MNCIQDYSYHDGKILSIYLIDSCAEVLFEKWDCVRIKLIFEDYWELRDSHSIGQNIDELLVNASKGIIDRALKNALDDGVIEEKSFGMNSYSFTSSWSDSVIFEIAAKNVRIEEHIC